MPASYIRFVVRTSIARAFIIVLNLVALGSFFFIQVGSIFLIVPAAIIDVAYLLKMERLGPLRESHKPSRTILKLALAIVVASLFLFSLVFLYEVLQSS